MAIYHNDKLQASHGVSVDRGVASLEERTSPTEICHKKEVQAEIYGKLGSKRRNVSECVRMINMLIWCVRVSIYHITIYIYTYTYTYIYIYYGIPGILFDWDHLFGTDHYPGASGECLFQEPQVVHECRSTTVDLGKKIGKPLGKKWWKLGKLPCLGFWNWEMMIISGHRQSHAKKYRWWKSPIGHFWGIMILDLAQIDHDGSPNTFSSPVYSNQKKIEMVMYIYIYSITDMCCCQLASAVAHLLPVLTSSCLCFVAPEQGPDSGPKNGATILKLVAQLPNLWPQFWAHGICALSCDRLHLPFMFSCAWCQDAGFTVCTYVCMYVCMYVHIYIHTYSIYIIYTVYI